MAGTVNTPPNIPTEPRGGSEIMGEDVYGSNRAREAWQKLAQAVYSLLVHKAPVLVCDTHAAGEQWMGYGYPVGTSYKHRYKFPTPYRALNNMTYRASIWIYGARYTSKSGAATTWEVDVSVNGAAATTYEVNNGNNGAGFAHKLADVALDYTADYTTVDIWLKTFGASMISTNMLHCLEIRWYAGFATLPNGLFNLADYGVPLAGIADYYLTVQDTDFPLSSFWPQMLAAFLEYIYERCLGAFISASRGYDALSRTFVEGDEVLTVIMEVRVNLPPGCPGVYALVYVVDADYDSGGPHAGAQGQFTLLASSLDSETVTTSTDDTWQIATIDCNSGDVVLLRFKNMILGTVMLFPRVAAL